MGYGYFGLACTFCLWSCTALFENRTQVEERDGYKNDSMSTKQ